MHQFIAFSALKYVYNERLIYSRLVYADAAKTKSNLNEASVLCSTVHSEILKLTRNKYEQNFQLKNRNRKKSKTNKNAVNFEPKINQLIHSNVCMDVSVHVYGCL